MSYPYTWYWNREHKDGDLAGRVPIEKGESYVLQIVNWNDEEAQTITIEYGSAANLMLTYAVVASSLALAYLF